MSELNVITLADSELREIEAALQERPLRVALPILQKIDSQLRAKAAQVDEEASKAKSAVEDKIKSLEAKVEAFTASAKAGIVHVLTEVESAVK
jgi:hypothetical protein